MYASDATNLMQRTFITADDLLLDSFRLAARIYESGFRPDLLIGIWRGGSAVGIAVQEALEYFGIDMDHFAIRTSYEGAASYSDRVENKQRIRVHGLDHVLRMVEQHHSMLIVDDVYSTGNSINAVKKKLARKARFNCPHDIRVAALWYRPTDGERRVPDYFLHETDDWLVLPYELDGLSDAEIREHKPVVSDILEELSGDPPRNAARR
ncbi:MAG: phosphoribosyltransferase family protein [Pseudomonadota bacterium]